MYFFLHFKNTTALQGGEQIGEKGREDRRPLGGCVGTQVRDGGGLHQHGGREDEGQDFKCSGGTVAGPQ